MSLAYVHSHDSKTPHSQAIYAVDLPTPSTIISASLDGSLSHIKTDTGDATPTNALLPAPHTLALNSLSSTSDGSKALVNSLEGLTRLVDLDSGEALGRYESYKSGGEPSWSMHLHPMSPIYVSTGANGVPIIHNAEPSEDFGSIKSTLGSGSGKLKFGMCVRWSPQPTTSTLALSSESGQIYVYDSSSEQLVTTFNSHAMCVRNLGWSADGNLLLSASTSRHLHLHDVRSPGSGGGGAVQTLSGHSSWVLSCDISNDAKLALSGSADHTIKAWDLRSSGQSQCVSTVMDGGEVWSVAWVGDNASGTSRFVSGGEEGIVRVWRGAGVGV